MEKNKKYNIALKWMNDKFSPDQLEIVISTEYPDSIFYKKNGEFVMEQDNKNEKFFFYYYEIWSIFEDFFGYNYDEIQSILKDWLEQTLKLEGFTPLSDLFSLILCWNRL